MSVIRVNRNPTRRQLDQFGFVWLGFMAFFGAVAWFKFDSTTAAVILWVASVVVPVIGWLAPAFMRVVFVGMSLAAWPIGVVVSHIVLALVYYLVMTPIGLGMRLFGYDPMARHREPDQKSLWIERETERAPETYFRQF